MVGFLSRGSAKNRLHQRAQSLHSGSKPYFINKQCNSYPALHFSSADNCRENKVSTSRVLGLWLTGRTVELLFLGKFLSSALINGVTLMSTRMMHQSLINGSTGAFTSTDQYAIDTSENDLTLVTQGWLHSQYLGFCWSNSYRRSSRHSEVKSKNNKSILYSTAVNHVCPCISTQMAKTPSSVLKSF